MSLEALPSSVTRRPEARGQLAFGSRWPKLRSMTRIMLLLSGGALCACAGAVDDAPVAEPDEAAPVIATLQLRDRQLTIASTSVGVRYNVTDSSGTRAQLTLEELAVLAPELAELARSASARAGLGLDARLGFGLDARLDDRAGSGTEPGIGWAGRAR